MLEAIIVYPFLSCLSHFCEFDVVFIENYLLYIMRWHLPHEQALGIAILVALDYFIFETQELQNLRKHAWRDRSFLVETLWHLSSRLLCEYFNRFCTFPELIELPKYLRSLALELLLQLFHSLNRIQLLPDHNSFLIAKESIDFVE